MKKVLITGVLGVFVLAMTSCGGGTLCPAYGGQADMTVKKAETVKTMKMLQELSQAK